MAEKAPLVGPICAECERTEGLDICRCCYKTVCPRHRSGFGSVSDGYTCMSGDCLMFGFGGASIRKDVASYGANHRSKVSFVRPRPWMWERGDYLLLGLVLALAVVVGIIIMVCGKHL